jgi:putative PIN family toxin of toxin-antitoxin system
VSLRLVFDTNSAVSALLFDQGRLAWLRTFWHRSEYTSLASKATVQELIRVLAYPKFKLGEQEVQALLADYLPFVESVALPVKMPDFPRCRDENDQMFIELAYIGKADVLVTGDADLLTMDNEFPFTIETPADFYRRIHN